MESEAASSASSAQLAAVFNSSFSDYVGGSVDFNAESIETWFSKNYVSLPRSRVFFFPSNPDNLTAFCFVAVRPDKPGESRIPIMGVVPSARGKGLGSRAVAEVIESEKRAGTTIMELECYSDNPAALGMYERKGYKSIRELQGWERDASEPNHYTRNPDLEECTLEEVDALVQKHGVKDLPWQASGFYKRASPDCRAYRLGPAYCVVTDPNNSEAEEIAMRCFIVDPAERTKGHGRNLVKAMLAAFPGKKWEVDPLFPKEYTLNIARELGFKESKEHQYQMRLSLI